MLHKIEVCSVNFTLKSKSNDSESVLDYIFVSSNLLDCVENYCILHRGNTQKLIGNIILMGNASQIAALLC